MFFVLGIDILSNLASAIGAPGWIFMSLTITPFALLNSLHGKFTYVRYIMQINV